MPALAHSVSLKSIAAVLGGGRFSPLALFAASEPGGWYDPSDLTTLYQDAAGTTPVTAVEQPVGLVLDKSKGLVLGSELFSPYITPLVSVSSSGSLASFTLSTKTYSCTQAGTIGTYPRFRHTVFTAGKRYSVSVTVSDTTYIQSIRHSGDAGPLLTKNGNTYSGTIQATASDLVFLTNGTSTFSFDVTSISVREVLGNHLTQSTSASRPVLSARVNLLTYSEQFNNAAWVKINATITADSVVAPDGTMTADLVAFGYGAYVRQDIAYAAPSTFSVYVKKPATGGATAVRLTTNNTGSWGTGVSTKFTLTSSWQQVSISGTLISSGSTVRVLIGALDKDNVADADCVGSILVWGADLRVSNDGVGLPVYQRVGAATDYTTTGFPLYLKFDGTDDFLVSNTINPGAVDKVQVFAGVRKLSDATPGTVAETSSNAATNAGSLVVFAPPQSTIPNYNFRTGGSISIFGPAPSGFAAPITNILTALGDIAGDLATLRINGTQAAQSTADQGTGNFGTYPLYVGRRNGASLPFNGHLYSLALRFSSTNLDAATISQMEQWVASKTGVSI